MAWIVRIPAGLGPKNAPAYGQMKALRQSAKSNKLACMAKKCKRTPNSILKLPDLEQSKSAVLNNLPSVSSQRSYDHAIRQFIDWYCSESRLALSTTDSDHDFEVHLNLASRMQVSGMN